MTFFIYLFLFEVGWDHVQILQAWGGGDEWFGSLVDQHEQCSAGGSGFRTTRIWYRIICGASCECLGHITIIDLLCPKVEIEMLFPNTETCPRRNPSCLWTERAGVAVGFWPADRVLSEEAHDPLRIYEEVGHREWPWVGRFGETMWSHRSSMQQWLLGLDLLLLVGFGLLWEQLWCTLASRLWTHSVAQIMFFIDEAEDGNEPVPVSFRYDVAPSPTLKTFVFKPKPCGRRSQWSTRSCCWWPVSRILPSRHQERTCCSGVGGWAVWSVCSLRLQVTIQTANLHLFFPSLIAFKLTNECVR